MRIDDPSNQGPGPQPLKSALADVLPSLPFTSVTSITAVTKAENQ